MKSVLLAVLAVLACAAASAHLPAVQSRGRANAPRAAARATEQPKVPTYRELQKFAVPALTLWISGPLLTLIDTSAVGLSASSAASGVFEIAALGPATSLCDGAGFLFAFLNIAATNLYASASADEDRVDVVRRGVKLAAICGACAAVVLRFAAVPALNIMVGGGSESTEVVRRAAAYVRVRAMGLPFVLVTNVLTAALLGAKDSVSPLKALAASGSANIVGDYLAVARLGRGARGAAEATLAAQVLACAVAITAALGTIPTLTLAKLTSKRPAAMKKAERSFGAFVAPVLLVVLSKIATFGAMTRGASSFGAVSLAAHQLAFTLYLLASLVPEALAGQTAQAFLPPLLRTDDGPAPKAAARELSGKLFKMTACATALVSLGIFCAALRGAPFFSRDARVVEGLVRLALPVASCVLVHGAVAHGEGILLAAADLKFVAGGYVLSALAFPTAVVASLATKTLGEASNVWYGFLAFQLLRGAVFQMRAKHLFKDEAKTSM